jgi:FlaA1/EpsC-like NDP-sugar epimerase
VPILEATPLPGLATNVLGTANLLDALREHDIERFVFVSTDKAVEPTSVLGYTKRFGELLTTAHAKQLGRTYAAVRFGNVLGSVGSVVPLFAKQIDEGGPVTVTHPEATRYLMTIEEAVGLLIVAGAIARPADLLVLDMGDPVSILELAKRMVRLRGLRTPADIAITYIGLRPGEKMHEALLASGERAEGTSHPRIVRVSSSSQPAPDMLETAVRAIKDRVESQDAVGALDLIRAVLGTHAREVDTSPTGKH